MRDTTSTRAARVIAAVVLAVSLGGCGRSAKSEPADPYLADIAKFREAREAALKTDTGWLTIAGLFFLTKPETTFGSDTANDIVLPAGAPARAGTFVLRDGKVAVKASDGVSFALNGKTVTDVDLRSDVPGPPDRIGLQDLTLWVHQSGDRLGIRLRDKNNHLRKEFSGLKWYPVSGAYRVDAQFVPYATPKTLSIPNIIGDVDQMVSPGTAAFTLAGHQMQMVAISDPDHPKELWFVFRDLTTGKETDPAARFLYTPLPENGTVTLDFNRAQNPPCAYNAFATCPLPPQENRMPVRVEAGEKMYGARP
jgi:uncharacterized protein (DUF1684 family)